MKKRNNQVFIAILLLVAFAIWVVATYDLRIPGLGERKGIRLGLDLQGGIHLVLQADLSKKDPSQTAADVLEGVRKKIEQRINRFGVSEPVIQNQGNDRIVVQLPGIKDMDEAVKLIGQTGRLDYREKVAREDGTVEWQVATVILDGQERELTGAYFKPNAAVVLDTNTRQPQVHFETTAEGSRIFEEVTRRNVNKQLGIFLDNQPVKGADGHDIAPVVRSVITGSGVIEGLSLNDARSLAILINSGVLAVPVAIIQQQNVDAILGADSLAKSKLAGGIGLALVILFMIAYYRLPGVMVSLTLSIYGVLLLMVFKLWPGFTLTLPGIAAFVLSLGMAVDANVLIFERTKEELRAGRSLGAAIEAGFNRAWTAIWDSNLTTVIVCLILYWFGGRLAEPRIMGFALTLLLGVLLSMFTAMVVSRCLLRLLISIRAVRRPSLFGISERAQA
ncbi:MAG: protein translocase subunit SecD [Chloroflexi bacterium]|nr:protein translocase subunit SecD [Chloroflexota bacterium]